MSILKEICDSRRNEVEQRKKNLPLDKLKDLCANAPQTRDFKAALQTMADTDQPAIIAEIKKRSPSAGEIRTDFDVQHIARRYEQGGAACLSILTESKYFDGDDAYIELAKGACRLPVLRKDFMVDPYQIYESRALGADCVLIILAALPYEQARDMHMLAKSLGLSALVECHDHQEYEQALTIGADLIGINSRNLKTQKTDTSIFSTMGPYFPQDKIMIAESGIKTSDMIENLLDAGYDAFLIGEHFMAQNDPGLAVQVILSLKRK